MTEGGTSKKVTIGAAGIAAELALAAQAQPNKLSFFAAVSIAVITLTGLIVQAYLDYTKNIKDK